jgi:hypothetical protein
MQTERVKMRHVGWCIITSHSASINTLSIFLCKITLLYAEFHLLIFKLSFFWGGYLNVSAWSVKIIKLEQNMINFIIKKTAH